MHVKPDLRVFLKWRIARSGPVIPDAIPIGVISLTGSEFFCLL